MPDASPRNFEHRSAESDRVSEPRLTEESFQESYAPSPSGPAPYGDEELYTRPARSYGGIIKWAIILSAEKNMVSPKPFFSVVKLDDTF